MTIKEAYQILGLPPTAGLPEIKKKYRKLMMQMHPDAGIHANGNYTYTAQEITAAYAALKEKPSSAIQPNSKPIKKNNPKPSAIWNAPMNPDAYMEREILQYAEDSIGTVFGNFCIARGKYMWTIDEDFSLFLLSLYQCSKQLLDEADDMIHRENTPASHPLFQAELTYLLAQQFISTTGLLKELAKEEPSDAQGNRIFYLPAMLEFTKKTAPLKPGDSLYPSRLRQHRLFLKNKDGQEYGYLSFTDDRLYYVIIPLFEQKYAQVKIQAADQPPHKKHKTSQIYQNLQLWLKLSAKKCQKMPENLNLQIKQLLKQYTALS